MAITESGTLTQEVQDALSAELLAQPDDVYLFYGNGPVQHADEDAKIPGTNIISFNRPTLPTGTYTEASRRLTETAVISLTGIAIAMTQVKLTTREYAGPHNGANVAPFAVTEFFKNRAKHNAIEIIGGFLRRDRNRFLDVTIRDLLLAATTVVTPDGSTSATIGAGVKASVVWLRILNKTMKDAKVPTFPNGRWRLILNTKDEQDLKSDPDYKEAMRYFAAANPLFDGHVMSMENFDIMVTTNISTVACGAGSALDGYQSCAFGPLGVGHGIGLEPSVRRADDTDFGRQEKVIWKSEEAVGTLYTDMIVRGVTTI